jgi:hypothetical protein
LLVPNQLYRLNEWQASQVISSEQIDVSSSTENTTGCLDCCQSYVLVIVASDPVELFLTVAALEANAVWRVSKQQVRIASLETR